MQNLLSKPLTETPAPGSVGDEYFFRMLSPYALRLSAPYNNEENVVLERCLQTHPNIGSMSFVAVGGGELWELRRATKFAKSYVCIEPLADIFINDSVKFLTEQSDHISYIAKAFSEVERDELPDGNAFFMFLFNILAYIEDPVKAINSILRPGDTLFITTWADTDDAKHVRSEYFDYLNSGEVVIDPESSIGLSFLDNFPFDELKYFKSYEHVKGKVVDVLMIYT